MARHCFFLKYLHFLIIVALLLLAFQPLLTINNCSGNNDYSEDEFVEHFSDSEKCYGIVIPLITGENLPYTSIEQSTSNMINDLLRLNITVFWAASNFSALTRTLSNGSTLVRYFERGAFVIPFQGNTSTNAFIISIATDYNIRSEIEAYYPVIMFFIMEPVSIDAYQLHYAKSALRFGLNFGYGNVYAYLDTLYSSGFLDIQLLLDDEISYNLNNKDFNLLIWPGGKNIRIRSFFEDVNITISKSIRDFVNTGGGYVGSCYGADSAASGPILPIYRLGMYKNNSLKIGFLALTSSSVWTVNYAGPVTFSLANRSHPLSFGLNTTQESYNVGGPVFTWATIDQNTQVIGVLDDVEVQWWLNPIYEKIPPQYLEKYLNLLKGKPIYISSYFGKGKVVLFGCHPEFHTPNRQDKVVNNAIFYVTSSKNTMIQVASPVMFSEIIVRLIRTSDIDLPYYHPVFNEIWDITTAINSTSKKIDNALLNVSIDIFKLDEERRNESRFPSYPHDFYQQWIRLFSKALMKLEQVYSLTKNTTDIPSVVLLWRNSTTADLHTLKNYSFRLDENLTLLLRNLKYYIGSPAETKQLINLLNAVEILWREGHKCLNQLWSSTVKIYRNCWYTYESELSITVLATDTIATILFSEQNILLFQQKNHGNNQILYVDDDAFIGGDGSLEHPYQHIQDAIDASGTGDSIFVHKGIYYEHLYISKSIKLIGEETNTTIIDGQNRPYHLIAVTKPNVELVNFTIQNSVNLQCGVILYSSNNTIRGNIIKNNGIGLGLASKSSNNTITENQFIHNIRFGTGIDTITQLYNHIENNIFRDNTLGLYVVNAYNVIRDNCLFNDGIFFSGLSNPLIVEIVNNTVNGKPLLCYKNLSYFHIADAGQIILSNCTNGVIENVSLDKTDTGIYVLGSSGIQIMNCTLSSNLIGIAVISSTDIDLLHNTLLNNRWSGIWVSASKNNQISNTFLSENTDGIYLSSSPLNMINNNTFSNNILGLSCWSSSDRNEVLENTFLNNYENAFDQSRNHWDHNYYNDWIGLQSNLFTFLPYHIQGRAVLNFDRHPAQQPYDIGGFNEFKK
jgi:parallel beta-helix repeat protein